MLTKMAKKAPGGFAPMLGFQVDKIWLAMAAALCCAFCASKPLSKKKGVTGVHLQHHFRITTHVKVWELLTMV
jgi:hypothetical protein